MAHKPTNIEGFEVQNGNAYFATSRFQALGVGGAIGTTVGGLAHLGGGTALFGFGQAWQVIPLVFGGTGEPDSNTITQRAAVVRVYYAAQFFFGAAAIITWTRDTPPTISRYVRVEIDALGQLSLNGVKSGAPTNLVLGTYYRLELFVDAQTGTHELRINGATEVSLAGVGIGQRPDSVQFGDERVGAGGGHTWDDVLIEADRLSPSNIDWPGAGRVERFLCNAVGTDNAWPLGAGASKQAAVSENPPDADVSYVHSNAAAADQTFDTWTRFLVAPAVAPSGALAVGEFFRACRVNTILRAVAPSAPGWHYVRTRSGGTVDETTLHVDATATYVVHGCRCYRTDPNTGVTWTSAAADALEAGLGIDNAQAARATNLVVQWERGPIYAAAGRAKLNPVTLGPSGPAMLGPRTLGG